MSKEIVDKFDSLTPATVLMAHPVGGTTYLFKWEDDKQKDDWRGDGYHWRQNGRETTTDRHRMECFTCSSSCTTRISLIASHLKLVLFFIIYEI